MSLVGARPEAMGKWDSYDGGDNVTPLPLRLRKAIARDPATIPAREWLYGTLLQRRYTTMLIAAGGTGKSQLALGMALDLASAKRLLGFHIFQRVPVWFLNLEDDENELDRRIAAYRLVHRISWPELDDHIYVHTGRERPVCMARIDPQDGTSIVFPDREEIVALARVARIGCIIVDPFVRSHMLDENNNPQMDAAMAAWNAVAEATGCAVMLVHHVRKGIAAGIEAARGAKALTDAARVGMLLSAMSVAEAEEIGIEAGEAHRFVRLDSAKSNMAPAGSAIWFEMAEVNLGNCTATYPAGDNVSALRRWIKPTPWEALDGRRLGAIFTALRAGPGEGEQFTLTRRGRDNPRWAGFVLMKLAGLTEPQAASILWRWAENGVIVTAEYFSPGQRKQRLGLSFNDIKIDEIVAAYGASGGFVNGAS